MVHNPEPINFIKVYNEFYDATEQKINPLPDVIEINTNTKKISDGPQELLYDATQIGPTEELYEASRNATESVESSTVTRSSPEKYL